MMMVFRFCVLILLGLVFSQDQQYVDISGAKHVSMMYDEPNVLMTFFKDNDKSTTLTIRHLDPISSIMNQVCAAMQLNDCVDTTDNISFWLTKRWYTPSLPHNTAEDYGSNRINVTKHFADHYHYTDYLEIGTFKNDHFNEAVKWFPNAVGVDPAEGGTLRMTSDEFFGNNSAYFDLVFVDGLHEANQAFKDVHNALDWLKPGGAIIMHDCNPRTADVEVGALKAGGAHIWTGDTWKAAVALRLRQDIEIVVVDVDYGVGVIRRRENRHPLPAEWVKYLDVNPISMLSYDLLEKNRHVFHRLMTMADMRAWLAEEENGSGAEL